MSISLISIDSHVSGDLRILYPFEYIYHTKPDDFVIRKGDVGRELFIISRGEVSVLEHDKGEEIARLLPGSFFGEIALMEPGTRRTGSVKSISISEINVLSQKGFFEISAEYPEFAQKIREITVERLKYDPVRSKQVMEASSRLVPGLLSGGEANMDTLHNHHRSLELKLEVLMNEISNLKVIHHIHLLHLFTLISRTYCGISL